MIIDNDLIIINKPAGIIMHPGAGNYDKTIVNALSLGGDARLYHLLKEVKDVRDNNPDGPYKKILRDKGITI